MALVVGFGGVTQQIFLTGVLGPHQIFFGDFTTVGLGGDGIPVRGWIVGISLREVHADGRLHQVSSRGWCTVLTEYLVDALVDLIEVRVGRKLFSLVTEIWCSDGESFHILSLGFNSEIQEAAHLGLWNRRFDHLLSGPEDPLESRNQGGYIKLAEHSLLDALLALDARVVGRPVP